MKRVLCLLLAISLLIASSQSLCYANSNPRDSLVEVEKQAEIVEEVICMNEVTKELSLKANSYSYVKDNTLFAIPRSGDSDIKIQSDGYGDINMGLPKEVEKSKGIMSSNGTVVYVSEKEDVAVSVQILEEKLDDVVLNAVRTMVTIENASAPKEYKFDFNLPQGYQLIKDTDYDDEYDEDDCGAIFIIDQNKNIVNVIDPAWAIDANGENIQTTYVIAGDVLIQKVEFDEDTAFPVIADPTSHPNKTKSYYLTKKQVKTVRDKYTESTAATIIKGVASVAGLAIPYAIGPAWTLIDVSSSVYTSYKYSTWDRIYSNFKKNYAKISVTWKWHAGKKCYYPTGNMKCTYVNSKS